MSVRIYVEGGGDQAVTLAKCRSGFARFFASCVREGQQPKVIACGGRDGAYRDFCIALAKHPNDTVLLLVDSEDELLDSECWKHLGARDDWKRPVQAGKESAYLMVRCMEAWFLADKEALVSFYGRDFLSNALPQALDVESVKKRDIQESLEHATKATSKGKYHKTQHGFDILAMLDPNKVGSRSPKAKLLIEYLRQL